MVTFRAIHVQQSPLTNEKGWAVERTEPDGFQMDISRVYLTKHAAEMEAKRLNHKAALRIMS